MVWNTRARRRHRRGAVLVLTALMLIPIIALLAFSIDCGYTAMVRTELQRAADSAALAGAAVLQDADELKGAANQTAERTSARTEAQLFANYHKVAGSNITLDGNTSNEVAGDMVIGYAATNNLSAFNTTASTVSNAVKVRLRKDTTLNNPINLFFAPILGINKQSIQVESAAYMEKNIKGFKVTGGGKSKLFPYAMNVTEFQAALTSGTDHFNHNTTADTVSSGADGIKEMKLFPLANGGGGNGNGNNGNGVTPGNFGTVDIGSSNNSTSDLARQITEGPNANDFSYFTGNTLKLNASGYVDLNGDTGISAGVKDEIAAIKGQARIIPLYESVSGNGNNAQFRIVAFAGVTVVDVQLTGSLSSKHITVQPCFCVDSTAIGGGEAGDSYFVRRPLALIRPY